MRIMFLNPVPNPKGDNSIGYNAEEIEKRLNALASPGTEVKIAFPDDFKGSKIHSVMGEQDNLNGLHHMIQTPSLVKKIVWAQENGYDAVIQSNTFDPGIEGGRLAVTIPVIGLLRTSLHFACTLADKIGIVVPLASHIPYTQRLLRYYGMENFVTSIGPIGVYGPNLEARKDEITGITVNLIKGMIAEGAQMIVPLGGLLIPYVVAPADLTRETGVQVVNTKAIGISFAESCVRMGVTQSALTYPTASLTASQFDESAYE